MAYTDNDYINLEYYGGFENMPNITISENDKSMVDNIYINSSYVGKILESSGDVPTGYILYGDFDFQTMDVGFGFGEVPAAYIGDLDLLDVSNNYICKIDSGNSITVYHPIRIDTESVILKMFSGSTPTSSEMMYILPVEKDGAYKLVLTCAYGEETPISVGTHHVELKLSSYAPYFYEWNGTDTGEYDYSETYSTGTTTYHYVGDPFSTNENFSKFINPTEGRTITSFNCIKNGTFKSYEQDYEDNGDNTYDATAEGGSSTAPLSYAIYNESSEHHKGIYLIKSEYRNCVCKKAMLNHFVD